MDWIVTWMCSLVILCSESIINCCFSLRVIDNGGSGRRGESLQTFAHEHPKFSNYFKGFMMRMIVHSRIQPVRYIQGTSLVFFQDMSTHTNNSGDARRL